MKNIIIVLLANQLLTPFFIEAVRKPHFHCLKCIDENNSTVKMNVYCTNLKKFYQICGVEKNDVVYIHGKKIKNRKKYYLTTPSSTETERIFYTIPSNISFHRNILNDTVALKIVKQDSTSQVYKFIYIESDDVN